MVWRVVGYSAPTESLPTLRSFSLSNWLYNKNKAFSLASGVPTIVNIRSPVSSCGVFAILILLPLNRLISVIFDPARPMMHPTISDGIEMFWVRRAAAGGLFVGGGLRGGGGEAFPTTWLIPETERLLDAP